MKVLLLAYPAQVADFQLLHGPAGSCHAGGSLAADISRCDSRKRTRAGAQCCQGEVAAVSKQSVSSLCIDGCWLPYAQATDHQVADSTADRAEAAGHL